MMALNPSIYSGLTYFNHALNTFEIGLNITSYFSPYPSKIRTWYGLTQVITSLSIWLVSRLATIIFLRLGQRTRADHFFLAGTVAFSYMNHGLANLFRAIFEDDKTVRPMMIFYDLCFTRFSYDKFFQDMPLKNFFEDMPGLNR